MRWASSAIRRVNEREAMNIREEVDAYLTKLQREFDARQNAANGDTPYTPTEGQLSRMVTFPQNSGELIALDEVDESLQEVMFKDVLAAAIAPRTTLPGVSPFLPLGNSMPRGDGYRYDDFPGDGNGAVAFTTPVPEPGSALLVALGLLGLAAVRSRS